MQKFFYEEQGYLADYDGEPITARYADLLIDDVFKLAFGQESTKDVMIEFLNQIITDKTIVDLEFIDKEMKPIERRAKSSVYDMNCKTDDGTRIVVELQRRKQLDYAERAIYYSTFQIRNQVDAGASSYDFCPVYVINILDFDLEVNEQNPDILTTFRLCETTTHQQLTDKYTLIFIELRKFKKTEEELSNILDGICFCFRNMHLLRERPKQLEHEIFKKIFTVAELANMDEVERSKILTKMTTERDLRNQMAYAAQVGHEEGLAIGIAEGRAKGMAEGRAEGREEGRAEGREEGRAEGRAETIAKLLEAGFDEKAVAKALGVSVEELRKCK